MLKNNEHLSESIRLSEDTIKELIDLNQPEKRVGDVIDRVLRERADTIFLEHLNRVAKEGDFVPIECDPEMAQMMSNRKQRNI